jgi:hypothetical protein
MKMSSSYAFLQHQLAHSDSPAVKPEKFQSQEYLQTITAKIIAGFQAARATSLFSRESNGIIESGLSLLMSGIPADLSLENKFKQLVLITTGTLLYLMSKDDNKYGKQQGFDNELLYPLKTLDEISAICNFSRFDLNREEVIKKIGEKVLTEELLFSQPMLRKEVFPSDDRRMGLSEMTELQELFNFCNMPAPDLLAAKEKANRKLAEGKATIQAEEGERNRLLQSSFAFTSNLSQASYSSTSSSSKDPQNPSNKQEASALSTKKKKPGCSIM